ncbi:MAG: hypothetical protein ACREFE_15195 [Limisphaerales bacterium]
MLNPILDGIHFWNGLEWLLARTIKLNRREDTSVRGHGPGPAWLSEFDPKNLRANNRLPSNDKSLSSIQIA